MLLGSPVDALGQTRAPQPQPQPAPTTGQSTAISASQSLRGRPVEEVRIRGNNAVSTAAIRNLIRTREGDRFDPATVEEDYQRVFGLRKFANVEARVEPTQTGVIVIFEETEQRQMQQITFRGNTAVDEETL